MENSPPESPPPRKTDGAPPPGKRSRVFLLLSSILLTMILLTFWLGDGYSNQNIERDFDEVRRLLEVGKLDGNNLVVDRMRGKILGDIERTPDEKQADPRPPQRFAIEAVTEKAMDRFRELVEARNVELRQQHSQDDEQYRKKRISLDVQEPPGLFSDILLQLFFVMLFIFIIYFFFFRQFRGGGAGGALFSFGKSRARLAEKGQTSVTFEDVAGITEAKEEVTEIIEFLRNPGRFQRLGGRIPRGVILAGSPGTGKTLLAKAIAGEAEVPFFSISGSDFVEMFVGVGASRVRDLFKQARQSSPCIIFFDEIDAVGRKRGAGLGGGHDEREQTLNAILVEMDGFDSDEAIVVVAATNRPDVLDPALLRPGRFDREIYVDLPDVDGREAILAVHTRKIKLHEKVDLKKLAQLTPTFSGAELAALVNEGAITAAMKDRDSVHQEDLESARDKIRWGREKKSRVVSEDDRKITAYHEAGHAMVAHLLDEVEPLHKVTIIPRGMALGATMQVSERDQYHYSRKQLLGNLQVLFAGRVAEVLFCEDITAGAKNDIERATDLARRMVCEWGMSDTIGPISYSDSEETLFLGREVTRSQNHSDAMALKIDDEVRKIVDESYQKAEKLLRKHRVEVERITEALLLRETLSGAEVARLVEGESVEAVCGVVAESERVTLDGPEE